MVEHAQALTPGATDLAHEVVAERAETAAKSPVPPASEHHGVITGRFFVWSFPSSSGLLRSILLPRSSTLGDCFVHDHCVDHRTLAHALTGLIGCFLFWALRVVKFDVAFGGFADETPWFLFGASYFGMMATKSGLARRLAYLVMLRVGNTYARLLLGLILSDFLLTFSGAFRNCSRSHHGGDCYRPGGSFRPGNGQQCRTRHVHHRHLYGRHLRQDDDCRRCFDHRPRLNRRKRRGAFNAMVPERSSHQGCTCDETWPPRRGLFLLSLGR